MDKISADNIITSPSLKRIVTGVSSYSGNGWYDLWMYMALIHY